MAVAAVAAVAALALPAAAVGAVGDLTAQGCIDDNDNGSDTCATSVDGLSGAEALATSPDGKSVYAVTDDDRTIVRFNRNPATGALTYMGCIKGALSGETCAGTIPNFIDAVDVAVSPDGTSVYLVSRFADSGVYWFKRNTTTGALTYRACVGDSDNPSCDRNADGIDDPTGVAVSNDGTSVYVADFGGDTVVRLGRNTTTGALAPRTCVSDNDFSGETCARSVDGLSAADSVVVSPDDQNVYVASAFDDAVVRFGRTATGALTGGVCVDDTDSTAELCPREMDGLDRPEGIAISGDGTSVYVAGKDHSTLAHLQRMPTGALVPVSCYVDNEFPMEPCADSPKGLTGAHDLAVSADGRSVYVAAEFEDAVTTFRRDAATGALTFRGCIKDHDATGTAASCPTVTNGLDDTTDVAVTADGGSVYASADLQDNAVVRFDRETPP